MVGRVAAKSFRKVGSAPETVDKIHGLLVDKIIISYRHAAKYLLAYVWAE